MSNEKEAPGAKTPESVIGTARLLGDVTVENYLLFLTKSTSCREVNTHNLGRVQKALISHLQNAYLVSHGANGVFGYWSCYSRPITDIKIKSQLFLSLLDRGIIECFHSDEQQGDNFTNYWRLRKGIDL